MRQNKKANVIPFKPKARKTAKKTSEPKRSRLAASPAKANKTALRARPIHAMIDCVAKEMKVSGWVIQTILKAIFHIDYIDELREEDITIAVRFLADVQSSAVRFPYAEPAVSLS